MTHNNITLDTESDAEQICMNNHEYHRQRLRDVGWSGEQIRELELVADGFVDFGRLVASEISYGRQNQ